jgi:beta-phosphoglucomutase
MKGKKAIIFDMDGTMVDNMDFHIDAWLQYLEKRDKAMTKEAFLKVLHGTMKEIIHRIFDERFEDAEIDAMRREKEGLYRSLYREHIRPIAGLQDFLEEQRANGVLIGLATAGDRDNIDFTLDGLGMRHYFQALIGAEEVQNGKPHPEAFLLAAETLGVDPAHCMAFEDSMSGIEAARRAGMEVIAVTTFHTPEEFNSAGVLRTIANYHELLIKE